MSEMGVQKPYARRGIDYWTRNRLFPIDGSVTMEGMKKNIEFQAKDGLLKEPLPSAEKYVDDSYLRQAQSQMGIK